MSESRDEGESAVEAMLAVLRERERSVLVERARMGGERAVRSMHRVLAASNMTVDMFRRKVTSLEAELRAAQVTIRAMVGQVMPEDARAVMDPPAGHRWTTAAHDYGIGALGRLYCVTCSGAVLPSRIVLAAECLERAR